MCLFDQFFKFYRDLKHYYELNDKNQEAFAIGILIEKKFEREDANNTDVG